MLDPGVSDSTSSCLTMHPLKMVGQVGRRKMMETEEGLDYSRMGKTTTAQPTNFYFTVPGIGKLRVGVNLFLDVNPG